MKISELIEELQHYMKDGGDREVLLETDGDWLSSNGQLTGDSAATVDKLSISVATKNVPSMDVDFLLAYGDGTWELKRHQVALSPKDLHDEKGELDLRRLNDCIDALLEDVYADSDVVAMVPYWLSMGSQFELETSLGEV